MKKHLDAILSCLFSLVCLVEGFFMMLVGQGGDINFYKNDPLDEKAVLSMGIGVLLSALLGFVAVARIPKSFWLLEGPGKKNLTGILLLVVVFLGILIIGSISFTGVTSTRVLLSGFLGMLAAIICLWRVSPLVIY